MQGKRLKAGARKIWLLPTVIPRKRSKPSLFFSKISLFDLFGGDYMDSSKSSGLNIFQCHVSQGFFGNSGSILLGRPNFKTDPRCHRAGIMLVTCEYRRMVLHVVLSEIVEDVWAHSLWLLNMGNTGIPGQWGYAWVCYFRTNPFLCICFIWESTVWNLQSDLTCDCFPLPVPWYHAEEPQGVAAAQLISEQALMPSCQISLKACLELEATLLSGFKNSWTAMILRIAETPFSHEKKPFGGSTSKLVPFQVLDWGKVVNPIINLQFGWFILFIQPMSGIPLGCGIMAEVLSLPSLPGRSKLLMALATAAKEVDRDSLRLSGFVTSWPHIIWHPGINGKFRLPSGYLT